MSESRKVLVLQDFLKEAFLAGWRKCFRHCNPDVGSDFGANPPTAEEAYEAWKQEQTQ